MSRRFAAARSTRGCHARSVAAEPACDHEPPRRVVLIHSDTDLRGEAALSEPDSVEAGGGSFGLALSSSKLLSLSLNVIGE